MNAQPSNPPCSAQSSSSVSSPAPSSGAGPSSLWDTASLISLVCSRAAVTHVRTPGVLRDPGWASAIPGELRRLHSLDPPTPHAGQAQRLAVSWLGAVLISEDAGARAEARVEKVQALSLYGLLGVHLRRGLIGPAIAATIVTDLHGAGHGPRQISLHLPDLIATGHVVMT